MEAGSSSRGGRLDEFATSLPIRLDYEACLAYLLLPPAGGVLLLLLEHKSDYVRLVWWFLAFILVEGEEGKMVVDGMGVLE